MKRRIIRTISVLLAVVLLISSFAGCQKKENYEQVEEVTLTEPGDIVEEEYELPEGLNPLTGRADLSEEAKGSRPIAIMVDNSPYARPQWGITTPDLIIEGVIENGVTRMMWVYADVEKIPDKLGPVRSTRHDYVELAAGMNSIFVHVGESEDSKTDLTLANQTIEELKIDSIDGIKWIDTYFKKDTERKTANEYRTYTTKDYIKSAIEKSEYSTKQTVADWVPYNIVLDDQKETWLDTTVSGPCSEMSVTFSSGYVHKFKYNETEKKYYNYLNDEIVTDGNNEQEMAVENLIVLYSDVTTLGTKEKLKEWNFEEVKGSGMYVSNGVGQRIYWIKKGKDAPIQLISFDGRKLKVNKGQTWMGIVPRENSRLTNVIE